MLEVESYERVIEGLKLAADRCAHLAVHYYRSKSAEGVNLYSGIGRRLDQVRLLAIEVAGLKDRITEHETSELRAEPIHFMRARRELRDGLKQASGGMRQLATCHRGDLRWSAMAAA